MQAALARPETCLALVVPSQLMGLHTPRVCTAPEYYCALLVGRVAENLMQLDGEAVEVTNVERAEVAVEGVVQQGLVDTEVHGRERLGATSRGALGARRALRRRRVLLGVRERRVRIRCVRVRGKVESILDILEVHRLSILTEAHCFELCYGANLDDLAIAGRTGARRL